MRTVDIQLVAGQEKKVSVMGYYLTLLEAAAPVNLDVELVGKAGTPEVGTGVREGYGENFPEMFNSITLNSAVNQTIKVGYGMGMIKMDRSTIISKQATSQADVAPATVGAGAASVLAGSATRQRIIFTADTANGGDIYLGGSGVTTVNSAIKLAAGESWIEERAAGAAWYAIASAAGQTLRINTAE